MAHLAPSSDRLVLPSAATVVELLKPVTWFPPMWAFLCGAVSSGADLSSQPLIVAAGLVLAGPLLCGTSQAVNDWFDRHVDAINEPGRPIPSGRLPGRSGFYISCLWTALSLLFAYFLGALVFTAAALGLLLSWIYSAPPLRLKRNGWSGPAVVGLAYEGLSWFTGAALLAGGLPADESLVLAVMYSVGAHGIMTLNDFKAIDGDRQCGVNSLPVLLGVRNAAVTACATMIVPQILVVYLLIDWQRPWYAAGVAAVLAVQSLLMVRLLNDPRRLAPWYNATGTTLYVAGMMISAFAVRAFAGG